MGRMNNSKYQVEFTQLLKAPKFETIDLLTIVLSPVLKPCKMQGGKFNTSFQKASKESQTLQPIRWSEGRSKE